MTLRYAALMWLASVHAHSQIRDTSCNNARGVIVVANPAISSTYWVEDTTCVFNLEHYNKTVDAISITRSRLPQTAGTIKLDTEIYTEDLSVRGKGEPFAILPMYATKTFSDVLVNNVTVIVTGKAMVSFGMAEDPALIFGEVLTDAYRARQWVYGAPYELLYLNVGLLLIVQLVAAIGDWNWTSWYCCVPWLQPQYIVMHNHSPQLANTASILTDWILCSLITDHFIWATWVWTEIKQYGGVLFLIVFFLRLFIYAYLGYILWERQVAKPGEWRIVNTAHHTALLWVPLIVGGCLTGYVFAWLYMGREAFPSCEQVYYIGIPILVGMFLWALPVTAAVLANGVTSSWYRVYVASACLSHLALVTLIGIVLNVGLGMLSPLCVLVAFWKRKMLGRNPAYTLVAQKGIESDFCTQQLKIKL